MPWRLWDRDGWRCVLCRTSLHGLGRSRVDHIRTRHEAPELALVLANLRSLCPSCDNKRHAEKGGSPEVFAALRKVPGLEDAWQLHRSQNAGAEDFADERIANLDESTGHWIEASASEDGSFTVTNGRTGATKSYTPRR